MKGYLEGTSVTIPYNVVWPGLRDALVDIGVTISEPAGANETSLNVYNKSYQEWLDGKKNYMEPVTDKMGQLNLEDYGIRYSLRPSTELVQNIGSSAEMLANLDPAMLKNQRERDAFSLYQEQYAKYAEALQKYQ